LGLLYLWRFVQREQMAEVATTKMPPNKGQQTRLGHWSEAQLLPREKMVGHTMDALALALIASPVVWEHHYLLAMPIVIWGAARARTDRQWWCIGISSFLMFVLPTFDIYPFSYHRLAGLLLLMATLSPQALAQVGPTEQPEEIGPQQPMGVPTRFSTKQ